MTFLVEESNDSVIPKRVPAGVAPSMGQNQLNPELRNSPVVVQLST